MPRRLRAHNGTEGTAMKDLNRIKGALYGVAVGDALGAPLEFLTAEQISQQHGRVAEMIGGGWLDVEPGEITDDTQMTLMVAQGITEQPADPVPAVGGAIYGMAEKLPKGCGWHLPKQHSICNWRRSGNGAKMA